MWGKVGAIGQSRVARQNAPVLGNSAEGKWLIILRVLVTVQVAV